MRAVLWRALVLDPEAGWGWRALAFARLHLRDDRRAVALLPEDASAWIVLAEAACRLQALDEALVAADQAVRAGAEGHHAVHAGAERAGGAVIRSLKEECIWQRKFESLNYARQVIGAWIRYYNTERPHQALGYRALAQVAATAA